MAYLVDAVSDLEKNPASHRRRSQPISAFGEHEVQPRDLTRISGMLGNDVARIGRISETIETSTHVADSRGGRKSHFHVPVKGRPVVDVAGVTMSGGLQVSKRGR